MREEHLHRGKPMSKEEWQEHWGTPSLTDLQVKDIQRREADRKWKKEQNPNIPFEFPSPNGKSGKRKKKE